jgi:hypothetical protein
MLKQAEILYGVLSVVTAGCGPMSSAKAKHWVIDRQSGRDGVLWLKCGDDELNHIRDTKLIQL